MMLHGKIMDRPLLISSLLDYAARYFGAREIVSVTADNPLHRTDYRTISARAKRHVEALARLAQLGERAVLMFCVMHTGIKRVRLADEVDPEYGAAVRAASLSAAGAALSGSAPGSSTGASPSVSSGGRCSAVIVLPVANTTARLIALRSSRMLPGHG